MPEPKVSSCNAAPSTTAFLRVNLLLTQTASAKLGLASGNLTPIHQHERQTQSWSKNVAKLAPRCLQLGNRGMQTWHHHKNLQTLHIVRIEHVWRHLLVGPRYAAARVKFWAKTSNAAQLVPRCRSRRCSAGAQAKHHRRKLPTHSMLAKDHMDSVQAGTR